VLPSQLASSASIPDEKSFVGVSIVTLAVRLTDRGTQYEARTATLVRANGRTPAVAVTSRYDKSKAKEQMPKNDITTKPLTAFSETAAKLSFAAAALFLVLLAALHFLKPPPMTVILGVWRR
jgi:hypothetical protein